MGIGLLLATLFGQAVGGESSLILLLAGVVSSLWPDVDFIVWVARGHKVDHLAHKHRDLLHRPFALTPLLTLGVWAWLGPLYALLFCAATLAHFIHDTIGHGWGIRWFWPIDSRYWCYRSFDNRPAKMYAWTLSEQDQLCEQYGNRNWATEGYSLASANLRKELFVLLVGVIASATWYVNN